MKWKNTICSCGCGKSYPKGQSKPTGWAREGDSLIRLTDRVKFSKGDIIQRFTEQGKQYCDLVITSIDFYHDDTVMYIRASTVPSDDKLNGSTNISDTPLDYVSANNPNNLRFIKKL